MAAVRVTKEDAPLVRRLIPVLLFFVAPFAHAADRFPFVIPGDDASPSPTNMSALSPRPVPTTSWTPSPTCRRSLTTSMPGWPAGNGRNQETPRVAACFVRSARFRAFFLEGLLRPPPQERPEGRTTYGSAPEL